MQDMDERNLECVCEWVAAKLQENVGHQSVNSDTNLSDCSAIDTNLTSQDLPHLPALACPFDRMF